MLFFARHHIPRLRVVRATNIPGQRYLLDPWRATIYVDGHAPHREQAQHLHDALVDMWDQRWKALSAHPAVAARRRRLRSIPGQRVQSSTMRDSSK